MELFLFLLLIFLIAALPAFAARSLVPAAWARSRYLAAVALFTLLVAPSWAAATIASVPVPFGVTLLMGVVTGAPGEIVETIRLRPMWHALSFSLTALVGVVLFRKLRARNSA